MQRYITYFMRRCVDGEERGPCDTRGCGNSAAYIATVPPWIDMEMALCESCAEEVTRRTGLLPRLYIKASQDAEKASRVSAKCLAEAMDKMGELEETLACRNRVEICLGDKPQGVIVDIEDYRRARLQKKQEGLF